MAPFKKKAEPAPGRRRPSAGPEPVRRGEMFSYYSRRSSSSSNTGRLDAAAVQEAAAKSDAAPRPVAHRWLVWAVPAALIAAFFALTALDGSSHVTIKSADGAQYFTQDESVYRQSVVSELHGSLLDRNKLTFDSVKLRRDITREYPEIKTVDVRMPLIGTEPAVILTPYKADYILTTDSGGSYVLDEAGHAVIPTSQLPSQNTLHLPLLHDKSGRSISLNTQAVASTTVNFIDQVRAVLTSQHVAINDLTLPADTSELDVTINGAPYFVKFNLQGDPRLQAGTFLATKNKLQKDGTVPSQYIDVRVPQRAYFK